MCQKIMPPIYPELIFETLCDGMAYKHISPYSRWRWWHSRAKTKESESSELKSNHSLWQASNSKGGSRNAISIPILWQHVFFFQQPFSSAKTTGAGVFRLSKNQPHELRIHSTATQLGTPCRQLVGSSSLCSQNRLGSLRHGCWEYSLWDSGSCTMIASHNCYTFVSFMLQLFVALPHPKGTILDPYLVPGKSSILSCSWNQLDIIWGNSIPQAPKNNMGKLWPLLIITMRRRLHHESSGHGLFPSTSHFRTSWPIEIKTNHYPIIPIMCQDSLPNFSPVKNPLKKRYSADTETTCPSSVCFSS